MSDIVLLNTHIECIDMEVPWGLKILLFLSIIFSLSILIYQPDTDIANLNTAKFPPPPPHIEWYDFINPLKIGEAILNWFLSLFNPFTNPILKGLDMIRNAGDIGIFVSNIISMIAIIAVITLIAKALDIILP